MTQENLNWAVLIVDDEPGLRLGLRANFLRQGWRVQTASGVSEAETAMRTNAFDLVLCDVRMGDGDGFSVLQAARTNAPETAFLFLTAFASVPEAVRAMQGGAVDYLTKPISSEHLLREAARLVQERKLPRIFTPGTMPGGMVGRSRVLQCALDRAQSAAECDADVLIEAESGTGKELLARFIHETSARRGGPFVAVNCAALPEALLESELFGHAKGAFTGAVATKQGKFELANGGTLLLDEIGDMPLGLQPKLLRVLQERVVERLGEGRPTRMDMRVIASTNLELAHRVERGLFRSDLFYRLNVIPLSLPPLRERMEDVPALAKHFAEVHANKAGHVPVTLHASFLERLGQHQWPGNVRELANFMQRVLSMTRERELTGASFDREHRPLSARPAPTVFTMPQGGVSLSMDQVERTHLERTLELVGGNRTRAAEMLGISVRTMRNKIRQYDLPPRKFA